MNSIGFIKLRGLPFKATEIDILLFLEGLPIWCEQSIILMNNSEGRPSGEALIKLNEMINMNDLSPYNGRYMGNRFIEVFQSSENEFFSYENAYQVMDTNVVRIRGLPYNASKEDIHIFFNGLMISRDGVSLLTGADDIPNGEAFVQFMTREDANMALQRHKECMGSRYIEVFKSSLEDAIRATKRQYEVNRGDFLKTARTTGKHFPPKFNAPFLNQSSFNSAPICYGHNATLGGPMRHNRDPLRLRGVPYSAKPAHPSVAAPNCTELANPNQTVIYMRGLPYSASDQDVRDFFSPLQLASIRRHRGSDGRMTGGAEAEFASPEDALLGMQKDHCKMSWRYIELFTEMPATTHP